MADSILNQAILCYEQNKNDEALVLLNNYILSTPDDLNAIILRARLYQRYQAWGDALNDLNHVLEIDPENTIAQSLKTMVMNIIHYWNKDNFNP
jgi:regulator of sirC expression with transglutaminase-like and TPR domain